MTRTKLKDRTLPNYTIGEERFHAISHIVGGAFSIAALVLCVVLAAWHHNPWAIVGGGVYGVSLVMLYTMSSIYHAIKPVMAKKVMQVLDHCTIYFLIAGTYTPVLLCSIRPVSPVWAWSLFGAVWGLCILSAIFTAIDLRKYAVLSMICYLSVGWCIVLAMKPVMQALPMSAIFWLVGGGVAYTLGAILYGLGSRLRYMHAMFHLFVILGSFMHFWCIFFYVM